MNLRVQTFGMFLPFFLVMLSFLFPILILIYFMQKIQPPPMPLKKASTI